MKKVSLAILGLLASTTVASAQIEAEIVCKDKTTGAQVTCPASAMPTNAFAVLLTPCAPFTSISAAKTSFSGKTATQMKNLLDTCESAFQTHIKAYTVANPTEGSLLSKGFSAAQSLYSNKILSENSSNEKDAAEFAAEQQTASRTLLADNQAKVRAAMGKAADEQLLMMDEYAKTQETQAQQSRRLQDGFGNTMGRVVNAHHTNNAYNPFAALPAGTGSVGSALQIGSGAEDNDA